MTTQVREGDQIDQYRLLELLTDTDTVSIFKALDTDSGASVVVKLPTLSAESDLTFFERFRREEAIGQRIDHPHVVKILKPRHKSREYVAMEYVEGKTVRSLLDQQRPLPTEQALSIARQVCEALAHLHEHGVVHRDVKPENVIVGGDGRVRLVDFGIALDRRARRITWSRLSRTVGTPDYMAPEQIAGRRGDARTDVYGLGIMLFEMLTGHLPYTGPSALAVLHAKVHDEPKLPRYFAPELDGSLEAIVVKATRRSPRDRHATAEALLADLRDPSAVAPFDPAGDILGVTPQRRRWPWMLAVIAVLGALLPLIWLSSRP